MSILLGIYLAGFFTTAGYGAGVCFESGGGHITGPLACTVMTTAMAPAWPYTVTKAILEKDDK